MARGKYELWLKKDGLKRIEAWCREGRSEKEIADNMNVSVSTLRTWKQKFSEFAKAFELDDEEKVKIRDEKVESALLKKALGYRYMETTYERATDEDGSKKMVVKRQVEKQASPDLSALTFWLKNRQPEKWKEKQEKEIKEQDIIVEISED